MDFKLKFPTFLDQASADQTVPMDDMKLGVLKHLHSRSGKKGTPKKEDEHTRGQAPAPKYNDFWN